MNNSISPNPPYNPFVTIPSPESVEKKESEVQTPYELGNHQRDLQLEKKSQNSS